MSHVKNQKLTFDEISKHSHAALDRILDSREFRDESFEIGRASCRERV